jgi:hypothetical protein
MSKFVSMKGSYKEGFLDEKRNFTETERSLVCYLEVGDEAGVTKRLRCKGIDVKYIAGGLQRGEDERYSPCLGVAFRDRDFGMQTVAFIQFDESGDLKYKVGPADSISDGKDFFCSRHAFGRGEFDPGLSVRFNEIKQEDENNAEASELIQQAKETLRVEFGFDLGSLGLDPAAKKPNIIAHIKDFVSTVLRREAPEAEKSNEETPESRRKKINVLFSTGCKYGKEAEDEACEIMDSIVDEIDLGEIKDRGVPADGCQTGMGGK